MDEAELRHFDIHLPAVRVHYDFRPIKIRVYRNGDELDQGKDVTVTRREFKHWIVFLDALTKKLGTTTAINRLHTIHGERIDHFDDLHPKGEYVAVERGGFIPCQYGKNRADNFGEKKWSSTLKMEEKRPAFLNSAEAMDIYLKHEGYGSYTGLPYPFDSILAKSPSASALHLQSHAHAEKFGGSLERLNNIGKYVWEEDTQNGKEASMGKDRSTGGIHLPKLVGLSDSSSVKSGGKHATFENIPLPGIGTNGIQKKENFDTKGISHETVKENKVKEEKGAEEEEKREDTVEAESAKEKKKSETKRRTRSTSEERKKQAKAEETKKTKENPSVAEKSTGKEKEAKWEIKAKEIVPFLLPGEGRKKPFESKNKESFCEYDEATEKEDERSRGPGIERIYERSEKRIIRELSHSDNKIYKPSREVVASSSSYKTYLWEARRAYDPDLDY